MKPMALSFYPTGIGKIPAAPLKLTDTDCITVNAFKKADVGEGYIIRLFNPTETDKTCKLCFYDKETTVSFGKYEIKTIRFDGNFSETDLMEGLLG